MGLVPTQELCFQRYRLRLLSEYPDLEKIKLLIDLKRIKFQTMSSTLCKDWKELDRMSVNRLFQMLGSAPKSPILTFSNFSKNTTCPFGLWNHSPMAPNGPDHWIGEIQRMVGFQLETLSLALNFLLLLAHNWIRSWRKCQRCGKGGLCPPNPPPQLVASYLPRCFLRLQTYCSAGGTPLHAPLNSAKCYGELSRAMCYAHKQSKFRRKG